MLFLGLDCWGTEAHSWTILALDDVLVQAPVPISKICPLLQTGLFALPSKLGCLALEQMDETHTAQIWLRISFSKILTTASSWKIKFTFHNLVPVMF